LFISHKSISIGFLNRWTCVNRTTSITFQTAWVVRVAGFKNRTFSDEDFTGEKAIAACCTGVIRAIIKVNQGTVNTQSDTLL
jgi:hypothetical protein